MFGCSRGGGSCASPKERGQFGLPALQSFDLRLELEGRDAGQDRIDGLVQFALGALQLAALGAGFGATLDPQRLIGPHEVVQGQS
ncbi:hypothetical protein MFUR16E_12365 [Methylobacterium fujisawaense]